MSQGCRMIPESSRTRTNIQWGQREHWRWCSATLKTLCKTRSRWNTFWSGCCHWSRASWLGRWGWRWSGWLEGMCLLYPFAGLQLKKGCRWSDVEFTGWSRTRDFPWIWSSWCNWLLWWEWLTPLERGFYAGKHGVGGKGELRPLGTTMILLR